MCASIGLKQQRPAHKIAMLDGACVHEPQAQEPKHRVQIAPGVKGTRTQPRTTLPTSILYTVTTVSSQRGLKNPIICNLRVTEKPHQKQGSSIYNTMRTVRYTHTRTHIIIHPHHKENAQLSSLYTMTLRNSFTIFINTLPLTQTKGSQTVLYHRLLLLYMTGVSSKRVL